MILMTSNTMSSRSINSKLDHKWRKIMVQDRAAGILKDFSEFIESFEKVVESKDNLIKSLMTELDEAEQQSAMGQKDHRHSLDGLMKLKEGHLEALESHWNTSEKEISTEYTEREQLSKLHQQESEYLKAETETLTQHYEEFCMDAKQDFDYACDCYYKKYSVMEHALKSKMTQQKQWYLEEQQKYINANNDKIDNTFDFQMAAEKMDLADKHIKALREDIKELHFNLSFSKRDTEKTLKRIVDDSVPMKETVIKLKAKISRRPLKSRLADYSQHSYDAIKKLQNIIHEGEVLLGLHDVCHKLEPVQEKVLPYYTSSSNAEKKKEVHAEVMSEELAQIMMEPAGLEKFWQRYNNVVLECRSLKQEKKVLSSEHQRLKSVLKQDSNDMSVREEFLWQPHSHHHS